MNALDTYIDNMDALIRRLSPAEQKRLLTDIGRKIRISNKRRIKANIDANLRPFIPRQGIPQRPLRAGQTIHPEQDFLYHGKLRRMRTIKTAETVARSRNPHVQTHNPKYVWGWEYGDQQVKRFLREYISLPSNRLRDKLMFRRIHQYKYLKMKASTHEAAIGFLGGLVGYIAAAHQYGEDGRPERSLIGLSDEDLHLIEETILHYLLKEH